MEDNLYPTDIVVLNSDLQISGNESVQPLYRSESQCALHELNDDILDTFVRDGPKCVQEVFGHFLNRSEGWRRLAHKCNVPEMILESFEGIRDGKTCFMSLIHHNYLPFVLTWRDILDNSVETAELIHKLKQDRLGGLLPPYSQYTGNLITILKEYHHSRRREIVDQSEPPNNHTDLVQHEESCRNETPTRSITQFNKPCRIFITYANDSKSVCRRVFAKWRENGFTATADAEEEHFSAKQLNPKEWIQQQFNHATVIVVLLSKSYVNICRKKKTDKCLHIRKIYRMMNKEYKRNEHKNVRFVSLLVSTSTNKDHSTYEKEQYLKKLPCLKLNETIPCVYDWPQEQDDLLYNINKISKIGSMSTF